MRSDRSHAPRSLGTWTESTSNLFRVRFDDDSRTEVEELVHVLETYAVRLEAHGLILPPHPTVVVHPTAMSLALAQPAYVAASALTDTHGRKYLASWTAGTTLHLIAPHRLTRGTESHITLATRWNAPQPAHSPTSHSGTPTPDSPSNAPSGDAPGSGSPGAPDKPSSAKSPCSPR